MNWTNHDLAHCHCHRHFLPTGIWRFKHKGRAFMYAAFAYLGIHTVIWIAKNFPEMNRVSW